MSQDHHTWSAARIAAAIARGETTSEAVCSELLIRISERDPVLQAWAYLDREHVLAQARARDESVALGPLHGVPVGIKDVIDTSDLPTQYNSPIYKAYQPKADASPVAQLKAAGAVILGKTVTTEFANINPAQTRNPRNLSHTPGGSSSGSAAAVADHMAPVAIGTQTAGSTIRPAAYCGIAAIKPSLGSINRTGVKPLAESLDTVGIFAREIDDLELMLSVLANNPAATTNVAKPRVGLYRTPHWDHVEPTSRSNIEMACRKLERAGAQVSSYDLSADARHLSERHNLIMGYESARSLAWEYFECPEQLSPALKVRLQDGWNVTRKDYDDMQRLTGELRHRISTDFARFDFLITPSAAGEAPKTLSKTGDSIFNRGWTLLGNPCVTIPFGEGPASLPLAVQLVGSLHNDMQLLAWAKWVRLALGD